jgi:cell division protein FtsW
MKQKNILQGIDPVLLVATGILLLLGLVILQSASGPISYRIYENPYHEFMNQLKKGVLPGMFMFYVFSNLKLKWLRRLSIVGWLMVVVLNILVLLPPFGVEVNGANRWIDIFGLQIQPAELLKLALIICLSAILFRLGRNINNTKSLILISSIILISAFIVIIIQSSLSNGIILLSISLSMLFQSKIKLRFISIFIMAGLLVAIIAISSKSYRLERVMTLLRPEQASSLDERYQINNNMIAVGSGGLFGVGLGESRQKFFYLPEASTDSIFAVFAEEAGFIGVIILLSIFLTIIFRVLFLYTRTNDEFSRYILVGGITWFSLQTIINIGPTIQLLPVTGVPLPFVSSGGTSVIVFCILFGIIANISKYRSN